MGKATEPPKCKACGKAHWGTCVDHENRGYLSSRSAPAEVREKRIAKAKSIILDDPGHNPKKAKPLPRMAEDGPALVVISRIHEEKPKRRGRPKTVPDRKAYKAEKERQRRAAKKDKP